MTQLAQRPAPPAPPAAPTPAPGAAAPGSGGRALLISRAAASATTVLAVMLFVFVAEMVLVGPIKHTRNQAVLYQEFRSQVAEAVAPTGQLGAATKKDGVWVLDDKKPVPLGAPVTLMAIPSLGLKEIVSQGTTSRVLMSGPGHRRDSPLPGQVGTVVVMGRQATYGGPFRKIDTLEPGDEIAFLTGQGKSLYKVTGIRREGDPAPAADATAARLTLMTGDGTPYLPSDVVRVDAALVSEKLPSVTGPVTVAGLSKGESPMAGDKSALLPLLLWSQLLLLLAVLLAWVRAVWGRWQSWMVCVPILGFVGFQVAGLVAQLLPNLI
ncbi:class E sortase [Nocardioides marmoriginsengisoli]|uniref:Class E sortase n=1 Tax=Nocardioides marmoriginsengisoli TaxID=661483 RepID=A0A3N0CIK6_9ACTN|nr:class E sortase [Nocardioides marmoriginsengisoli]RNL63274.1 class E sortase [Nocardioides marmoriginsengisoli]